MFPAPGVELLLGHVEALYEGVDEVPRGAQSTGGRANTHFSRQNALELLNELLEVELHQRAPLVRAATNFRVPAFAVQVIPYICFFSFHSKRKLAHYSVPSFYRKIE